MKTVRRQALILLAALAPAVLCVQCSGLNGWVQVKNPFQEETGSFQRMMEARRQAAATKPPMRTEPWPASPEKANPPRYFGDDSGPGQTLARKTAPDAGGATPVPPGEISAVNPKPRAGSGAICYRCNGKGYQVQFGANAEAEEILCPQCAGAGRR
jgi:hypothetical protein